MKILLVGGTFTATPNPDNTYGKPSGLIRKMVPAIKQHPQFLSETNTLDVYNGGPYPFLNELIELTPNYDIVFWFPNVPDNNLPKIRDVKSVAPKTMLVTSKRNDNNKYTFQELVQRALASKSNLMFEFSKTQNGEFHIHIFDPLGCSWYHNYDIRKACHAALSRLIFLKNITRQSTIQNTDDKSLVLKWYFDQFTQPMQKSSQNIEIPDEQKFIDIVHKHAETFHKLMNPGTEVKRFLGNCSMKPPQVGRCSKGMPSFKHGDYIFVSKRNVDKEYLDLSHFVPCYLDENENVFYCGDDKPSVDTPIQLRLYKALPNIRYMIHSHCYIKPENSYYSKIATKRNLPCGAIEEVDEILNFIDTHYHSRDLGFYKINLIGHGSIVMSETIDMFKHIEYERRPFPEYITEQ